MKMACDNTKACSVEQHVTTVLGSYSLKDRGCQSTTTGPDIKTAMHSESIFLFILTTKESLVERCLNLHGAHFSRDISRRLRVAH